MKDFEIFKEIASSIGFDMTAEQLLLTYKFNFCPNDLTVAEKELIAMRTMLGQFSESIKLKKNFELHNIKTAAQLKLSLEKRQQEMEINPDILRQLSDEEKAKYIRHKRMAFEFRSRRNN